MDGVKVLHVSQPTIDGVCRHIVDAARDQVARGWGVTVASPTEGPLAPECRAAGAAHVAWEARREPGRRTFTEARAVARIVGQVDPDVVVLQSSKAGLAGRLAVRGRRATIFVPHAWSFLYGSRATRVAARSWERLGARWSDTVVCVSEAERRIGERTGIRASYDVVPNAVDLRRFSPVSISERSDLRQALGLDDAPLAVSIGRLVEQKGHDVLLRAWPEVRRRVPDANLVVAGEGPLRDELTTLLSPGARLVGRRDDVVEWLRASDVVVLPSRWEGLSYVVLEAIACGRSVVACDVAGMREALSDGQADAGSEAGALVAPGDTSALADAVACRLADPDLAAREGARAGTRAARFDLCEWGDRWAGVIEGALARHRTGVSP